LRYEARAGEVERKKWCAAAATLDSGLDLMWTGQDTTRHGSMKTQPHVRGQELHG